MGYEIAGGLGVKLAAPDRDVYVLVGDGSYLMMASELVTAVQEGVKLIVVLVQNHGFASIGALSETVGAQRFGTRYRYRDPGTGRLDGAVLPVDLAANAASLGVQVCRAQGIAEFRDALRPGAGQPAPGPGAGADRDRPAGPRAGQRGVVGRAGGRGVGLASTRQARQAYQAAQAGQRQFRGRRPAAAGPRRPKPDRPQPGRRADGRPAMAANLCLGSAPDSWGVWFPADDLQVPYSRFLDELAAAGYQWFELGPYGYLPTDPARLAEETSQARPQGLRRHRVRRAAPAAGVGPDAGRDPPGRRADRRGRRAAPGLHPAPAAG